MFKTFKTEEFRRAGRFFISEIKNNYRNFSIAIICALAWSGLVVVQPYLIKKVIDDSILPNRPELMITLLSYILLAGYVRAFSIGIRRYVGMEVSYNVEAGIRNNIFSHMQKLDFSFHDRVPTGDLMARGTGDASQVRMSFGIAPLATANIVLLFILSFTLLNISLLLGSIILISIPVILSMASKFAAKAITISTRVQEAQANMTTEVEELLGGIRVVKAFGKEESASDRVDKATESIFDSSMDLLKLRSTFVPLFELIPMAVSMLVLVIGGYLTINDSISLGDFVAFTQYIILLVWPLRITAWFLSEIPRSVAAANRILDLLDEEPRIIDNNNLIDLSSEGAGEIVFEEVKFRYGVDQVLNGASFIIKPGQTVAIVGATGSGKSTLAYLLPRLYEASSGTIKIDGVDIKDVSLQQLRKRISIAFEESFLFSSTAQENIAIGSEVLEEAEVRSASVVAHADDFISDLPDGYNTEVGERGYGLSGGQRQRIALARAILRKPKILILDDAMSAVDASTEENIRNELKTVLGQTTTLIITNRVPTIEMCDEVIFLEDGKVKAQGSHEELKANEASYKSLMLDSEEMKNV
ncbi:MAG: ABC transporter ATP-binding protein [Actinomycetota bacterium]|nr:ABC transporter ATP-binding protein [Actinomycetota bacterium]|tara:strand:+ start:889 stop:2646 length:1758 start_codon:yes stop_codon:yes gene_type:complete